MPDIRPILIRAIQSRPALWMKKHPHYKPKIFQREYWQQVVADLPDSPKITVETVKKQWKNLKDTYRKELRRPYQQWKFCDDMSFIKEELINSRRPGSPSGWTHNDFSASCDVEVSLDDNNSKDSFEKDARDLLDNDSFGWSPKKSPQTNDPFLESERNIDENVQESASDFIEKIANGDRQSTSKAQPETADYHFLMSILPEMEKLSPMQKMRVRNKINAALMEEMSIHYGEREPTTEPEENVERRSKRKRKNPSS